MVAPGIKIEGGISVGGGISIGADATPITGGTITYDQMPGPVVAGQQLEDNTATVNNPIGFTINNSGTTGVAVTNLSPSNQTFFSTQGTGVFLASFGPGSTYATATVQIVQTGASLVFFINPTLSYPATFNYPFIIS
jgi:hypothetical protein